MIESLPTGPLITLFKFTAPDCVEVPSRPMETTCKEARPGVVSFVSPATMRPRSPWTMTAPRSCPVELILPTLTKPSPCAPSVAVMVIATPSAPPLGEIDPLQRLRRGIAAVDRAGPRVEGEACVCRRRIGEERLGKLHGHMVAIHVRVRDDIVTDERGGSNASLEELDGMGVHDGGGIIRWEAARSACQKQGEMSSTCRMGERLCVTSHRLCQTTKRLRFSCSPAC